MKDGERMRERESVYLCVCVCMCAHSVSTICDTLE